MIAFLNKVPVIDLILTPPCTANDQDMLRQHDNTSKIKCQDVTTKLNDTGKLQATVHEDRTGNYGATQYYVTITARQ